MEEYCIYLRKSRADAEAEKAGQGETLARHEHILLSTAEKLNLHIGKIYREIKSGESIAARPQMQKLLEDMEKGMYSGVLVMEVERLARGNTIDQGIVAQAFKERGIKIITPMKIYDPNNEFDEEYFEFSLFMSRREYKTIKRRMQAGREASVREGNYIGSNAPYGYRKINPAPKVRTLGIVEEEALAVRMIFDMYLNAGMGAKAITSVLDSLMIKPRKSSCWEAVSVRRILKNPVYAGKIRWHTKNGGEIITDGRHEAIIPYEIFCNVQERMNQRSVPRIKTGSELKNYYHNLLFCANCGRQLKRRPAKNSEGYMLCTRNECRGKTVSSPIEIIDGAVIAALRLRLMEMELETDGYIQEKDISAEYDDIKRLAEKSLNSLKKQKEKLYILLETGVYTTEVFNERIKILEDKEKMVRLQLEKTRTQKRTEKNIINNDTAVISFQQIIDEFPAASGERKNELLRKVIRRINYGKTERMCRNKHHSDMKLEVEFF